MSAGWGLQPYGLSGFGADSSISIVSAYAISTNQVVVELARAPLNISGFVEGDVSNPRSWSVTLPDTGETLDVAGVIPFEPPTRWVIHTLQKFSSSTGTVQVSTTVRDSTGGSVQSPSSAVFAGVTEQAVSTPQNLAATTTRGGKDLRNVPTPVISDTSVGGVLSIVGGDYSLSSGAELVKKLITRRLITAPGDFFHIPNYGVGLDVKQPLPGGGLVKLKVRIERQVLLEPDVQAVQVSLVQSANLLTVVVAATLASTGKNVTVSIDTKIGQGING